MNCIVSGKERAATFRTILTAAFLFSILLPQATRAQEVTPESLGAALSEHGRLLDERMGALPSSLVADSLAVENAYSAVRASMDEAAGALEAGRLDDAIGRLLDAEALAGSVLESLGPTANSQAALQRAGLTSNDIANVQTALGRMAEAGKLVAATPSDGSVVAEGVSSSADQLSAAVSSANLNDTDEAAEHSSGRSTFDILSDSFGSNVEFGTLSALSDIVDNLGAGIDLEAAAREISNAISDGVDVNLEGLAESAGFDSFADAVDAYNEAYGTSYSVDEARDALGQ